MLNFAEIILRAAQAAADRPVLAAPYPLSEILCRELTDKGFISGFVANSRRNLDVQDPLIAGWWLDQAKGIWFLRGRHAQTLILLSGEVGHEIGGSMLLEARLKGIRRILLVSSDGSTTREVDVCGELLERLRCAPLPNPIYRLSYDSMFEDIYELMGDLVRLGPESFAGDRMLILIGSLRPGGAERQATYTAIGLAQRACAEIYVGRSRGDEEDSEFFKPLLDQAGVRTCYIPEDSDGYRSAKMMEIRHQVAARYYSLGGLNILHALFHYALLIREVRPALVHCWLDYCNVIGGLAADLVGVPKLILSGRSLAPDNFLIFQPYMAPAYHALLNRRKALFLNNSEAGARDYARWLNIPRSRFQVIHNGVEFPNVPPGSRETVRGQLRIPQEAIVVGSIIGFREEKRPLLWTEMALALHKAYPKVRFLVFGDGPLLETCRSFVAANDLAEIVVLPGFTTDSWAALSAMDIFVLTSRAEGLPNVMIEAQAMGLPTVCTGTGGMFETFVEGITGFGVSSATAEALAEVVGRLIQDSVLREQMSKAAKHHARETFGIEQMIDRTLEAYAQAGADGLL
jgi:glycosyltransferase involved in cell wall biosynthesis